MWSRAQVSTPGDRPAARSAANLVFRRPHTLRIPGTDEYRQVPESNPAQQNPSSADPAQRYADGPTNGERMTHEHDLTPAARRLADLLGAVPDDRLGAPTPCEGMPLGTLLDHVDGLSLAFAQAAAKDIPEGGSQPPPSDASNLRADWRTGIPERLGALAAGWREPSAWEGMTEAGGVKMPGGVAASVALNELVVHGWDVARATGQPYTAGDDEVEACLAFVAPAVEGSGGKGVPGLFEAAVPVPDGAPPLDRLIALTGRDPSWAPPA
jgi:uncharacterized protein (TIGR03086 family)